MIIKRDFSKLVWLLVFMIYAGILVPADSPAEEVALSAGQTVYVPIYSHIYSGVKGRPFDLAATLSIRNTNTKNPITLVSVKYYDSDGKLVEDYLNKPKQLNAMVSARYRSGYDRHPFRPGDFVYLPGPGDQRRSLGCYF